MSRFSIRRWLNALRGPAPRRRQRPGIRPRLEVLEDRTCPSTLTVTSAADDGSSGTLRSVIAGASAGSTIVFDSSLKDQFLGALYNLKQAPADQKEALISEISQRFHLSSDEVRRLAGLSQKQIVDFASAPT